jgi:AraC family transcriptional regulator
LEPRIEVLSPKKLVGFGQLMSLANDSTAELWQSLMPRRHEIRNRTTDSYISMRVYLEPGMMADETEMFAPATQLEKWAAVEVTDHDTIPPGMQRYALAGGLYAVFLHKGPASGFVQTMRHIFGTWLPNAGYELDDREHFELIPEGWSPTDLQAKEEIWVPIR